MNAISDGEVKPHDDAIHQVRQRMQERGLQPKAQVGVLCKPKQSSTIDSSEDIADSNRQQAALLMKRVERIETRLVRFMSHFGIDPNGNKK